MTSAEEAPFRALLQSFNNRPRSSIRVDNGSCLCMDRERDRMYNTRSHDILFISSTQPYRMLTMIQIMGGRFMERWRWRKRWRGGEEEKGGREGRRERKEGYKGERREGEKGGREGRERREGEIGGSVEMEEV